ncbi:hypothetical protein B0H14DRAFT_3430325 [Mycena olivaceomarginata]|nr:hypothetical protein B0H14DRAFT_3430325 [Mycena olivaceomarginata]
MFLPVVEKKRLLPENDKWPFLALDEEGQDLPADWRKRRRTCLWVSFGGFTPCGLSFFLASFPCVKRCDSYCQRRLYDYRTSPMKFSLDKYHLIFLYKTAYYSFYLPFALAMHMSGLPANYSWKEKTIESYTITLRVSILLPLGEYFQIQNDFQNNFLDFRAPEVLSKVGTDVTVLDENYGRKDAAAEVRVKVVFEAVGLREQYAKYEAEVELLNVVLAPRPHLDMVDLAPQADDGTADEIEPLREIQALNRILQHFKDDDSLEAYMAIVDVDANAKASFCITFVEVYQLSG